jgi:hypothetical protein
MIDQCDQGNKLTFSDVFLFNKQETGQALLGILTGL